MANPRSDPVKDVVKLLAKGYDNNEIAAKLFISVHTVKSHLKAAYKRYGCNRRTCLAVRVAIGQNACPHEEETNDPRYYSS